MPDEHQDPTPTAPRARRRSTADRVRAKQFPVAMRGYDRAAVDAWRNEVAELLERMEAQQPRDTAVRRALDEVGQETAGILQRAHEAAEEIVARSRSQADGRLRHAEEEAEATVREAEERAARLEDDARAIWDERSRLLDEMRQLADEVLAVADDALDRMPPPPGRGSEEPTVEDEPTLEGDPGADGTATLEVDPTVESEPAAEAPAGVPGEPGRT